MLGVRLAVLAMLGCFVVSLATSGCSYWRIDPWHVLVRSDYIRSLEQEKQILSKARLEWTGDKRVRVLYVSGSPYERGYQHGALLRKEIQDNFGYLYKTAQEKFHFDELFAEAYERMQPFIPAEYIEEMHGLAHGSRLPLAMIHHLHILPELGEWGGKKQIKGVIKQMMAGDLGTSCSNFSMTGASTVDGEMYVVRILDWGLHRISKLHEYPLITVNIPENGVPSANIGWVGFLGAVSGMNAEGITLGEMGYGDPPNETLRGRPMPFLLRDVLSQASSLGEAELILKESIGTNSFVFLISDGKTKSSKLFIKDRDRFKTSSAGQEVRDGEEHLPAISDVVYGGHYNEKMAEMLSMSHGKISCDLLQDTLIPEFAMKSNFQNVIYLPSKLQFWVSNARDKGNWAASESYSFFDLKKALITGIEETAD